MVHNDMQDDISDELTGYAEHLRDSESAGDHRHCPHHPNVITSSADGLHDAPCGHCENEGQDELDYNEWKGNLAKLGPICNDNGYVPWNVYSSNRCRISCADLLLSTDCYLTQEQQDNDTQQIPF